MTEILYCQSPALFLLAVVLLICFLLRRQAHRVRAAAPAADAPQSSAGGTGQAM